MHVLEYLRVCIKHALNKKACGFYDTKRVSHKCSGVCAHVFKLIMFNYNC